MIKDCFGIEARVGDEIAFSQGNAGAKAWEHAVITKVSSKTVTFRGRAGGMWRDWQDSDSSELRRGAGCFVIDVSKRSGAGVLESKANAWDSLSKHIKDLKGAGANVRDEVSEQLSKDGCYSSWVHHASLIDELVRKYEDSDYE